MDGMFGNPLFAAAAALLLACLAGHVVHSWLRYMHSSPHVRKMVAVYEGALLVHLVVMAALAVGGVHHGAGSAFDMDAPVGSFAPILWANIAVAAVAAYTALSDLDDAGEPEGAGWMPAAETLVTGLCTPLALSFLGTARVAGLVLDVAYFAARTLYLLSCDRKNRRKIVSPITMAEAIKSLPEGILYADERGRIILANDTMRRCLLQVGVTGDARNMDDMWKMLNEKAHGAHAVPAIENLEREPGAWVVLRMNGDEVRLFSFESAGAENSRRYPTPRPLAATSDPSLARSVFGTTPHSRIIAYDVTEEVAVLEEIERANEELASAQRELKASAETAREAAENEAMLRMRGRVHDVIGQRLSMLHRALEDNDISDGRLEQLKPLLNGILDDLTRDEPANPADELSATVSAFALTGVSVVTDGRLPEDERCARLFANCIREAATNAVKHARARRVVATMGESALEITNDGMQPTPPVKEGTGLSGMRRAVEAEGGSLEIAYEPFTLRVSLPEREDG